MTAKLDLRADVHGHAVDYACSLDRAWFAAHPGQTSYDRSPVDHETCLPRPAGTPCEPIPDVVAIRVTQLAPGVRVRQPLVMPGADR